MEAKTHIYEVADIGGFKVTSREGLETLRKIYDVVDILHYKADRNKKYGKILYYIMILLTLLITVISIVSINVHGLGLKSYYCKATAYSCVINTVLIFIFKKFDPINKWKRLRSKALLLQSEVWKWRTRSGI